MSLNKRQCSQYVRFSVNIAAVFVLFELVKHQMD